VIVISPFMISFHRILTTNSSLNGFSPSHKMPDPHLEPQMREYLALTEPLNSEGSIPQEMIKSAPTNLKPFPKREQVIEPVPSWPPKQSEKNG
jgi:hypothetical protein